MPGHVFVLRGDITRLACDAWLIPCDRGGRGRRTFLPSRVPDEPSPWPSPTPEFLQFATRVLSAPNWPGDPRQAWLVNVGYESRSGQTPDEFYRQSVGEALRTVFDSVTGRNRPLHRRVAPIVAVPLLGGEQGMPMVEVGRTLRTLLDIISTEMARNTTLVDVALVTFDTRTHAAAQHERREQFSDRAWSELNEQERQRADCLADLAKAGRLALFLGAGIGAGAGLPMWGELLGRLANAAGLEGSVRSSLMHDRRDFLDQASFIQHRLGGAGGLQRAVVDALRGGERYSLTHALLAALPVREAITTNYDQLFEDAWAAAWRSEGTHAAPSVIPHRLRPEAHRWLLKLHGCVSQPESIVLTRESYIRYNHQYAALEGILQAALLTRHLLFVGFSLKDSNFLRILDAVRRVLRPGDGPPIADAPPFSTALMLGRDEVMGTLYQRDLDWVAMSVAEELTMQGADFGEPGRRLEVFLDYLLARVGSTAHLLGDDFASLLGEPEQRLRAALQPLVNLAGAGNGVDPSLERVRAFLEEFGWTP